MRSDGRVRRSLAVLFCLGLVLFFTVCGGGQTVIAAPELQLPWPTGQQHRINSVGNTYGCDTNSLLFAGWALALASPTADKLRFRWLPQTEDEPGP